MLGKVAGWRENTIHPFRKKNNEIVAITENTPESFFPLEYLLRLGRISNGQFSRTQNNPVKQYLFLRDIWGMLAHLEPGLWNSIPDHEFLKK